MTRDDWLELTVLERKKYNYLTKVQDVTRQLAEAADRDDEVAARMLVSMRQEPTDRLAAAHQALDQQQQALPGADAARLAALLKGAEAETEAEAPLVNQVSANKRVLKQLVDLDRIVNRKLARGASIYK